MSLLLNMLLVIAFLPRRKCLLIPRLQSPSAMILKPPQNNICHCFPICLPWSDGTRCHDLSFLNVEFQTNFFTLCFCFHQEALQLIFAFCHKGSVICISVVIDISPGNLDFSLHSSSPQFLMLYSAYSLKKQGDNIQPWCTPFPIWNQSAVPCPVLTVTSWPGYRFHSRQVR